VTLANAEITSTGVYVISGNGRPRHRLKRKPQR
jgi:hypothetical protein